MPELTINSYAPTADNQLAFWLPQWLAGEKPIEPAGSSDHVFVAEPVPDRETEKAWYVRQGNAGVWIPKSVARVYHASADADIVSPQSSPGSSTEGSA
ncbi:hypothetical protein BRD15_05585 [Halobacteriales archaeon SW_6_65_15]|nr:MAG: hypothetical protein BRD15_05585 [Halobacteriales archaeon SW_6_65_15]